MLEATSILKHQEGGTSSEEDNRMNNKILLDKCETSCISKTIIELFIHLQEQKNEQNNGKVKDSRL